MLAHRNSLTSVLTATIATLIVMGTVRPSFAEPKRGLEGSWVVGITEGAGTPDLPTWYKAFVTFDRGRGLVASITDPSLTSGHGVWVRSGPHAFDVSIFLSRFGDQGQFLGTLKARATLRLDQTGDRFTSDSYEFAFFDPDGQATGFAGTGSAHGLRMNLETAP